MLRLTEALFATSPSAQMMDYYERVLFNHILASHDNERAMAVYYTPLFPGAYRVYADEFDSMWCCVGTGLEVPGKYGQMIYSRSPENLALNVNLFASSQLTWPERQVTLKQQTEFPYEAATTLTVETPQAGADFALRVRHPAWVPDRKLGLVLNGKRLVDDSVRGSYFTLRRIWKKGDVLRVELPMGISVENLPGSNEYVAFLYGPIVLSGELGRTGGLAKEDFWQTEKKVPRKLIPESEVPMLMAEENADLSKCIKLVDSRALRFRTVGFQPVDVSLIPFFENHFQRYAIYWKRGTPVAPQIKSRRQLTTAPHCATPTFQLQQSTMRIKPVESHRHRQSVLSKNQVTADRAKNRSSNRKLTYNRFAI
jgi:DUF1680 family protein